jgi:hypothetical protein
MFGVTSPACVWHARHLADMVRRFTKDPLALTVVSLLVVVVSCTAEKATPAPVTPALVAKPNVPSFVPPTAEQAYRLQDDCSRRGEAILRDNAIGSALTQEEVSRYNPTTNRCYVRLEVHGKVLSEWEKYDHDTYLEDGQTGELLAFFMVKPDGKRSFLGFGCGDESCVEEKVAACMSGKECDPN